MNAQPSPPPKRPNPIALVGLAASIAFALVTKYEPDPVHPNLGYADRIATSHVATACNGHTGGVVVGKWYTDEQCNVWTLQDLATAYRFVYACTYVRLTPYQQGALTDFALNEGGGALCRSTMLKLANQGKPAAVWCRQLLRYNLSGGHVQKGLVRRRNDEYALCLE